MKRNVIILISLAVLLSACAPSATYKPYGVGSALTGQSALGYRETEIEKGKWFVQYVATASQDEFDMVRFVTRRANEVGQNQCHGSFTKSSPTINTDV